MSSTALNTINYKVTCLPSILKIYRSLSGIVYGVCDEILARLGKEEGDAEERCNFGLKTAQGLLEFECESKMNKQKWVDGVQNLLRQVKAGSDSDSVEQAMEMLKIN